MKVHWRTTLAVTLAIATLLPLRAQAFDGDYYVNSSGQTVHRPEHASKRPAGATARCRDGEYSFSRHHRGTCSGHGGVAQWYR